MTCATRSGVSTSSVATSMTPTSTSLPSSSDNSFSGTRELIARIRALLRRTTPETAKVIRFANAEIDVERRIVINRGAEVKLAPAEYNLLIFFLHNPDRPLTRDLILNSVWGYESYPNTRTVDAHVVRLRQKLEPDAAVPRHFLTIHGVGYRFLP